MKIESPIAQRYDERMAQPDTAPAPYRFTREEYHRMGEAGLFEGKRVELLADPEPLAARHGKTEVLGGDGRLPLPGGAAIAVAELLPPR